MNTKIFALIAGFALLFIAFVVSFGTWGTIDPGHRGVVVRMGAVTGEIKGEGAYLKAPFITSIYEMDVRTKKDQVSTSAGTKDLQVVNVTGALNSSLDPSKVAHIYQTVGRDYNNVVVAPAMQEAIKAGISPFTAEELISKRGVVRDMITVLLREKLSTLGIRVEAFNIVDLDFSPAFNDAIERKVTAEQNALAAKNNLEKIRFEAEQAIVKAKGEAEALRVKAVAISQSPQILELEAIKKWDGKLPVTMAGGSVPFLNLKK